MTKGLFLIEERRTKWYERKGSNLRPTRCKRVALPLSYARKKKTRKAGQLYINKAYFSLVVTGVGVVVAPSVGVSTSVV